MGEGEGVGGEGKDERVVSLCIFVNGGNVNFYYATLVTFMSFTFLSTLHVALLCCTDEGEGGRGAGGRGGEAARGGRKGRWRGTMWGERWCGFGLG